MHTAQNDGEWGGKTQISNFAKIKLIYRFLDEWMPFLYTNTQTKHCTDTVRHKPTNTKTREPDETAHLFTDFSLSMCHALSLRHLLWFRLLLFSYDRWFQDSVWIVAARTTAIPYCWSRVNRGDVWIQWNSCWLIFVRRCEFCPHLFGIMWKFHSNKATAWACGWWHDDGGDSSHNDEMCVMCILCVRMKMISNGILMAIRVPHNDTVESHCMLILAVVIVCGRRRVQKWFANAKRVEGPFIVCNITSLIHHVHHVRLNFLPFSRIHV